MSQPRRSARLAARFQSTRSSPPSPAPSCFVCVTDLVLCFLNLSSAPRATLSLLLLWISFTSSTFAVRGGSCRRVHDLFLSSDLHFFLFPFPAAVNAFITSGWLGQSTIATTTALFAHRSSSPSCLTPLRAVTFEHLNISIDFNALPANSSLNSLCVPDGMPHLPPISLCCAQSCGSPDCETLGGPPHGMVSYSPVCPRLVCLVLQWVCHSCGSSITVRDIPALPTVSCPQCSSSVAIVFDKPTGRVVRFCVSCQLVVPSRQCRPATSASHSTGACSSTQQWSSCWLVLARSSFQVSISLRLGTWWPHSSRVWHSILALFCLLISLGLALAESRLGVLPHSTGNREQVLSKQSQFWTTHALPSIRAYADHFHSLDRSLPAAALLQSWEGKHLDAVAQEVVTPATSCPWLQPGSRTQSPQFLQWGSSHHASCTSSTPFPTTSWRPFSLSPPLTLLFLPPFTVVPSPSRPRSLFASLPLSTAPASGTCDFPPPLVASPFVSTLLHHPLSPRLQFLGFQLLSTIWVWPSSADPFLGDAPWS